MAVGRKDKKETPPPVVVAGGQYGRLQAPEEGTMFVRDEKAAYALSIQKQIAAFELVGAEVPEHLAALAESIEVVEDGDDIVLVDALTGEVVADVDVVDHDAGEDLPEGAARSWQTSPEPAAEEEAEEEAEEYEEEDEEEEEVPVEDLTVDELKDELDAWGAEYASSDRKADLQKKLTKARASGG